MKLANESHGQTDHREPGRRKSKRIKCDCHTKCEYLSTRIPGGNTSYEGC